MKSQEKEIETVGGSRSKKVDVRIIAATNKDLAVQVEQGKFRADLFFRLNIFPINVPPLRQRGDDIKLLANHFTNQFSKEINRPIPILSNQTIEKLMAYSWPGNVRELKHYIERSILMTEEETISINLDNFTSCSLNVNRHDFELKSLEDVEREQIIQTLRHCNGKIRGKGGAAEILKLHPNTLDFRIKKLNIKKEKDYK